MLVSHVAWHEDRIHRVEEDHESLRREVRMLAGKVRGLEQERDYEAKSILHAYVHSKETHSLVRYQQIMIKSLEKHVRET